MLQSLVTVYPLKRMSFYRVWALKRVSIFDFPSLNRARAAQTYPKSKGVPSPPPPPPTATTGMLTLYPYHWRCFFGFNVTLTLFFKTVIVSNQKSQILTRTERICHMNARTRSNRVLQASCWQGTPLLCTHCGIYKVFRLLGQRLVIRVQPTYHSYQKQPKL